MLKTVKCFTSSKTYLYYGSPERQVREINSGDPFYKSDLNFFLFCVYDLRTGEKKNFLPE